MDALVANNVTKRYTNHVALDQVSLTIPQQTIFGLLGPNGAGNLTILLPTSETPMLVKIKDSWLCSVKMPGQFKKISENVFANAAYTKDSKNSLTFDLDVSMGNIIFSEASR